jgi:quercetin dioxygenase-like cupin family protein
MKTIGVLLMFLVAITVACSSRVAIQDGARAPREQGDNRSEVQLNNLLTQALSEEFAKDREVIVSHVEIPPNTTMDRHWHPGEEFHYYIEGKVAIDFGDGRTIDGTPGKVGYVPFKELHTAITGGEAARFIVFRIHEKGLPVRYLEDGSAADK